MKRWYTIHSPSWNRQEEREEEKIKERMRMIRGREERHER